MLTAYADVLLHISLILFFSLPVALAVQLKLVESTTNYHLIIVIVAILSWAIASSIIMFFAAFIGLLPNAVMTICVLLYLFCFVTIAQIKPNFHVPSSTKSLLNWRKWITSGWAVTGIIVSFVALLELELGSRGPVEVRIDVAEKDKQDFVVSIYSSSAYKMKKIAKAGEPVIFPRRYATFNYFSDWLKTKVSRVVVNVSVEHPEYSGDSKDIALTYHLFRETKKVTFYLTHWDTKFAEMEESVKLEPDRALELRVETIRKFENSIGHLKGVWLQTFPKEERSRLKKKYESWIYNIERRYPERQCQSIKDCIKKIDKGILSEKEPSPLRWN